MSDLSFEQMLEETLKTIRTGEVVTGKVIDVKEDQIVLNIGFKSDGIITRNEYTNDNSLDLRNVVQVGDDLDAKVLKVNDGEGQVLLSYKRVLAEKGSKVLEDAFNNQEVLKAKVVQVVDGGLTVVVDEQKVFIPASLVSDTFEKNLAKYDNTEVEFIITDYNPKKRRIIGDRKALIVERKAELKRELFSKIRIGDVVNGIVKNVTEFGAFIDIGGVDALLHISEMGWGKFESPKKKFKSGDEVTTFIKDISGEKIALSMKFPDQNPWFNADQKYARGNVITGRVARMTDFGAFVEIEPGIDALLHVSQISKEHVDKPSDVLTVGQEIEAVVLEFVEEDKKISISIRELIIANERAAKEEAAKEAASESMEALVEAAKEE